MRWQYFLGLKDGLANKHEKFSIQWKLGRRKLGLPWWLSGKESAHNVGYKRDVGSIPESERFPGEGNGNHSSILAWQIPWAEEPCRL